MRYLRMKMLLFAVCMLPLASLSAKVGEVVYRLSPFDKVSISVYGEPDLETKQLIADSGEVFLPLLGGMQIGGLTVSEASETIKRAFIEQEFLRKPVVTISIEEFAPKVVTVLGEVENPGSITIPPGRNGLPIQIAIAGAGGFSGAAKTGNVAVTRANPEGKSAAAVIVDVDKLLEAKGSNSSDNLFIVYPDDVVFVPRRVF